MQYCSLGRDQSQKSFVKASASACCRFIATVVVVVVVVVVVGVAM